MATKYTFSLPASELGQFFVEIFCPFCAEIIPDLNKIRPDNLQRETVEIRRIKSSDTSGVVALYDRAMAAEWNIGPVSREEWERFVHLPQNQNGQDFYVAIQSGSIIGVVESSLRDQGTRRVRFFKIVVDPQCRCRGIGSQLLAIILSLDAEGTNPSVHAQFPDNWTAGISFLTRRGFALAEFDLVMRNRAPPLRLHGALTDISFMRLTDAGDQATVLSRIHNAAYANDAGFRPHNTDEIAQLYTNAEVWIALRNSQTLAFCIIEVDDNLVWLESLAVDPSVQGQGIGSALAHYVLTAKDINCHRHAGLTVSSLNPAANHVYSKLGFHETSRRPRFAASRDAVLEKIREIARRASSPLSS